MNDTTTTAAPPATNGQRAPTKLGVLTVNPDARRADLIREIHERLQDVDEFALELRDEAFGSQLYRAQAEALAMFETLVEWDQRERVPRAQWVLEEGS